MWWTSVRGTSVLLVLVNCFSFLSSRQWSARVVTTRFGSVRGFLFIPPRGSWDGVEVFLGLPYASPPVGSLRFMPPVSGSPWPGTKMTPHPAPVCPQVLPPIENETEALKSMPKGQLNILRRLIPHFKNQSEDCLYLNVYVPLSVSAGKANLLPVLVFVHGVDYGYGGGHPYDPSMLVSQGQVIVVTMNYRLGILGFLNANSDGYFKSPANFALLDQIAALHWVQENIGAFGGDRGNVTLMGHGRGGIFANFLMISSAVPTGLLFQRVILASGSALSPAAAGNIGFSNGKDLAKRFGASLKCPSEPPSEMLNCLRQTPLEDFLESDLWKFFGPSDDGVTIEDGIKEPLLRDRLSHYPLLFGVTKVEMLGVMSDHDAIFGIETERRREILKGFIEKHFSVHRNEILAAAIHEYTEWERPVQHPISVRDETLDALADAQVVAPLVKTGDFHSHSNQKSFFYVFEYQSKGSDFQQRLGCVHGEDLHYILGVPLFFYGNELNSGGTLSSGDGNDQFAHPDNDAELSLGFFVGNFTRAEVQLSQTAMQLWTNFIKTGNPNEVNPDSEVATGVTSGGSRLGSDKGGSFKSKVIEWPHYDPMYKKYLAIDMKPRTRTHYRAHKLSFWLHLVPDLMKNGYGLLSGSHNNVGLEGDVGVNLSATPPPPTIQLVGPPLWEHHNSKGKQTYFPGNLTYEGGATGSVTHGGANGPEVDGYQLYSTALSVTIAIGCSLLILNILIFAACYYQRDKRRNESMNYNDGSPSGMPYGESSNMNQFHAQQQQQAQSAHAHRKENGQIGGYQGQMPNICGDLPTLIPPPEPPAEHHLQHPHQHPSGGEPSYVGHAQLIPRGTLKRAKTHQQPSAYEMTMPDAILAAAMMNIHHHQQQTYSPHNHPTASSMAAAHGQAQGSPCGEFSQNTLRGGRRSSLTFKDQMGNYTDSGPCVSHDGNPNSRTMPRPPKRTTPSVKFSCGDALNGDGGDGSASSTSASVCGGEQSMFKSPPPQQSATQTLKPSLKKSSNYAQPATTTDELKV